MRSAEYLCRRLRELRVAAKLKRTELVFRTGISYGALASYENDRRRPSLDHLVRLAEALGCSIDDLVSPTTGE